MSSIHCRPRPRAQPPLSRRRRRHHCRRCCRRRRRHRQCLHSPLSLPPTHLSLSLSLVAGRQVGRHEGRENKSYDCASVRSTWWVGGPTGLVGRWAAPGHVRGCWWVGGGRLSSLHAWCRSYLQLQTVGCEISTRSQTDTKSTLTDTQSNSSRNRQPETLSLIHI